MKRIIGIALVFVGSWMLVSPQALTGLVYLKWMHKYAFAGEVLLGIIILCLAYYCIDFKRQEPKKSGH